MGTRRKYRLVGQLGQNRRLASVSTEAALLYVLALPYGDREGRLPGDAPDLIDEVCSAQARRRGWEDEQVDGMIAELVRIGLWSRWGSPGGQVIGIERWKDHQHPSKLAEESESVYPDPPSGTSLPESNRIEPKRSEGKGFRNRTEPNGTERNRTVSNGLVANEVTASAAAAASVSSKGDAQRLMDSWKRVFRKRNAEHPDDPIPTPGVRIFEAEQIARELEETLTYFTEDAALDAEIHRVCACAVELGWVLGFTVCRQIGKAFPGTKNPDPVVWKKQEASTNGRLHPSVAALIHQKPKEMPA